MSLKKIHIFYGWYIVVAFFFIWAFVGSVVMNSFTAYIEPISSKFGWTYTSIAFGVSLHNIAQIFFLPVVGILIDRWSAKKLVFAGVLLTGLCILLLSRITSIGQFYFLYFLTGITSSTCISTIPLTVVGRWFREKMSLATGIMMAGVGSAGLLVPLVTRVIDMFGWQMAMMILGLVLMLVISPLSLIIRSHPENRAYSPDSEPVLDETKIQVQISENEVGIKQALKNRIFWHIAIAYTFHFLVGLAVATNIMPYLSTIGIARNTASFFVSALAIGDIIGRLVFGWIGERLDRRYTAASGTILVALSLLLFTYIMPVAGWVILPAIIIFGAGFGGTVTMQSVLLRDYFGTGKLGSVIGFSVGITRVGVMIGPPLASWIFESFNSYNIAWLVLTGMAFIGIISLLTSPSIHILKQKRA